MSKKKITIIISSIVLIIFLIISGICLYANNVLNKINYDDWSNVEEISDEDLIIEKENTEELQKLEIVEEDKVEFSEEEILAKIPNVSNILLIGEENQFGDTRGRTDSMMVLTINTSDKTLKLTSLMRDTYVKIPNHQDNRLNAAYNLGGVPLLVDTIETNYGITIDNSVLVNFEAFSKIIDILGGVDVELTEDEAEYLNSTNYITQNDKDIICYAGKNHFNGIQSLGYCRVRYVKCIDGQANDFGRTSRQRIVLSQLYQNYKNANLTTLLNLVNEILPYITTDMTKDEIINYVTAVVTMNPNKIQTFRLPIDGGYNSVSIRGMSVLNLDWEKNVKELKTFLYGDLIEVKEAKKTDIEVIK